MPTRLKGSSWGRKLPIAEYDLYIDKGTGQVFIYRKKGKGEPIPTGIFIK
ncbi:polymorphic toxin type 33 domain-containing protein [Paenibacillus ihbetae]|nr:polymorphic toxin type 33 domain-containing protein [Paenibacillus ihbetae]